ncbi:conjugal transfer protein [Bacillus subtilis]|uniref:conjugal transfer protein n=1 Tax=Bacillus subtilis TaxID=1423 RepID=UPI0021B0C620|nr:conjugal transfer protein [Bacillus subtilis]MCT6515659.1 conjugal transfer protein [Bacillus subtilis]
MRPAAYSFRKFFRYPLKLWKIGKGDFAFTFSKGVEIRQIIVTAIIFGVLFLFRERINQVLPTTLQLAFYVVLPWMIAGAICRLKLDGKRLDRFFIGYFRYLYNKRFSYSSHKPVYQPQMKKAQSYEKFE